MNTTKLHYIYDPLCGWCYAVAPLVKAAREVIPIELHGGGMLTGTRRQTMTPAFRDYVGPNDRQIALATGQVFGNAYLNGLLNDDSAVLDSEPPTAAVFAAEELKQLGVDMLARLYEAHYVQGLRIADVPVLVQLAVEVGLPADDFADSLARFQGARAKAHFSASRDLLLSVGGRGYPTFLIEQDGACKRIDHTPFLGNPLAWQSALAFLHPEPSSTSQVQLGCGPDGCHI